MHVLFDTQRYTESVDVPLNTPHLVIGGLAIYIGFVLYRTLEA